MGKGKLQSLIRKSLVGKGGQYRALEVRQSQVCKLRLSRSGGSRSREGKGLWDGWGHMVRSLRK